MRDYGVTGLNLSAGVQFPDGLSLEQRALWAFQHDYHPLAFWPESDADPAYDQKLKFCLPILRDYLRLIVRQAGTVDIAAFADECSRKLIAEHANLGRYDDGTVIFDEWSAYIRKFRPSEGPSCFPFGPLTPVIAARKDKPARTIDLGDFRSVYLSEYVKRYFPETCSTSADAEPYPAWDDEGYERHVQTISHLCRRVIGEQRLMGLVGEQKRSATGLSATLISNAVFILRPNVLPNYSLPAGRGLG